MEQGAKCQQLRKGPVDGSTPIHGVEARLDASDQLWVQGEAIGDRAQSAGHIFQDLLGHARIHRF